MRLSWLLFAGRVCWDLPPLRRRPIRWLRWSRTEASRRRPRSPRRPPATKPPTTDDSRRRRLRPRPVVFQRIGAESSDAIRNGEWEAARLGIDGAAERSAEALCQGRAIHRQGFAQGRAGADPGAARRSARASAGRAALSPGDEPRRPHTSRPSILLAAPDRFAGQRAAARQDPAGQRANPMPTSSA